MRLINFCIWWIGLSFIYLWAQQVVPNQKVIENLFFQALDSILIDEAIRTGSPNYDFENLNDEQKSFCRSRIVKYFDQKKLQPSDKVENRKLIIQQFEPQIKYFESVGQLFGAGKRIKRQISLKFSAYLSDPEKLSDNAAYWELNLKQVDQVDRTKIRSLEQSPYSFTRGNWASFSAWTRILQPMVIIGSMTILVYLFYSLRS